MRVEHVADPALLRTLVAAPASVAGDVSAIVADVRERGDVALLEHARRLDGLDGPIRVDRAELDKALAALDPAVRAGLEVAIANVRAVAQAGIGDEKVVELEQGHTVTLREHAVRRAAIYSPGGRNPYPSTVVMGVVTARTAGVEQIVVCAPRAHPVVLAACALCGADEVLHAGGAHVVAALAYGTESIERADVIAGPGGLHVQEAKRQVSADVGIDMFAGPSDLMIVADDATHREFVIADLLAQAEHGEGSVAVLVSDDDSLLSATADAAQACAGDGVVALVESSDPLAAIEQFSPEHLQLVGPRAEALAPAVRSAGCVLVGPYSATAFSDYVAGSNHTLPTAGAARFASGLSVADFRRRSTEVRIGPDAAAALAAAAEPIARAEGFARHAQSMSLRENDRR